MRMTHRSHPRSRRPGRRPLPLQGFTLVELMTTAAIIGILASIVLIKAAQSRDKAIRASIQVDLKTLVSAQEGFYSANADYAGGVAIPEKAGTKGAGRVAMTPSPGNKLTLTYRATDGWTATITNPKLLTTPKTCGVFMGPSKYSPNKKVVDAGVPACY